MQIQIPIQIQRDGLAAAYVHHETGLAVTCSLRDGLAIAYVHHETGTPNTGTNEAG